MSQNQAIHKELTRHRGKWVPMPALARAADCYAVHSRIADLRKSGLQILNRTEQGQSGKRLSFYKLVS